MLVGTNVLFRVMTQTIQDAGHDSSSPWPNIEDEAFEFLLDVRDDFEAGLLRDWVNAQWKDSGPPPTHRFIRLPKGPAGNRVATL